uniref:Coiled-coil-helix-coiled-coil-helix domain containing 4 n=1 Tax=Myotis lucifugus TaxID=59463 RepID=G1QA87_MYOLU
MANCRQEGKDPIIFVTKENHETPGNAELVAEDPNDPFKKHRLILPNGDINRNYSRLGGMANGLCGEPFKSFSCFNYSTEDTVLAMEQCMQKYQDHNEEEEGEKPAERLEETELSLRPPTKEEERQV